MAKTKFSLVPNPTFPATVKIPVPGDKAAAVAFTFIGRSRTEFAELAEKVGSMTDVELVMAVASGWELDDPFGPENVEKLLNNYLGASDAIFKTYLGELTKGREGN